MWKRLQFIRSEHGGAGYNPELGGSMDIIKALEDRASALRIELDKIQRAIQAMVGTKTPAGRAGSSGTPLRLNGSSGWRKRKFGLRSASGSSSSHHELFNSWTGPTGVFLSPCYSFA